MLSNVEEKALSSRVVCIPNQVWTCKKCNLFLYRCFRHIKKLDLFVFLIVVVVRVTTER